VNEKTKQDFSAGTGDGLNLSEGYFFVSHCRFQSGGLYHAFFNGKRAYRRYYGCDALWRVGTIDTMFLAEKIYIFLNPEFFNEDLTGMETEESAQTKLGFWSLLKNLEFAAESRDSEAKIKQLRNKHDFSFLYSEIAEDSIFALSQRLETDYSEIIEQLLAAGANINTTDKNNRSPSWS
jgi:hypothetical protein